MAKRSKKVIFCVHCLLNQNARAQGVAKCAGAVPEFLDYCVKNEYGIVPIDCPQLMFEPIERQPDTKEHYLSEISVSTNQKVAKKVIEQIKVYLKAGYEVCGVSGVSGSPTCGAVVTHRRNENGGSVKVSESGVFFDELKRLMNIEGLELSIFDWNIREKKVCKNEN